MAWTRESMLRGSKEALPVTFFIQIFPKANLNLFYLFMHNLTGNIGRKSNPNLSISHKEAFLTAVKAVLRKASMLSTRH